MKRTEPNKRDKEKCIRSKRFVIFRRALIKSKANRDKARDSKRDRLQPFYPAIYQHVSALRWNVPGQVEGQDKRQTQHIIGYVRENTRNGSLPERKDAHKS